MTEATFRLLKKNVHDLVSGDISQRCLQPFSRRVNHLSLPRLVHESAQLAHSRKPKLPFARASVWLQNGCIQKGVLFWRSQALSDVNNVGEIFIGPKEIHRTWFGRTTFAELLIFGGRRRQRTTLLRCKSCQSIKISRNL